MGVCVHVCLEVGSLDIDDNYSSFMCVCVCVCVCFGGGVDLIIAITSKIIEGHSFRAMCGKALITSITYTAIEVTTHMTLRSFTHY